MHLIIDTLLTEVELTKVLIKPIRPHVEERSPIDDEKSKPLFPERSESARLQPAPRRI